MGRLKNMRHEQFITELFKADFNQAEAYRRVYPSVRRDVARVCAAKVLTLANVKRRLEERQQAMIRKADVTVDRILNEYEDARQIAISQAKPEAMMAASEKKAKLVGLLVDRREQGNVGDFENLQSPEEVIAKLSEECGPEVAEAAAKAFGLQLTDLAHEASLGLKAETSEAARLDTLQEGMRLDQLDPEGSA